jgi:hypothetical protein
MTLARHAVRELQPADSGLYLVKRRDPWFRKGFQDVAPLFCFLWILERDEKGIQREFRCRSPL